MATVSSDKTQTNAFTVDVEDWFHILDCPQAPFLGDYEKFESRVDTNTKRILDLLEEYDTRATFFILGWVAERKPSLVQQIASAGHELGVHGFEHSLAKSFDATALEADTRRAVIAVADAAGTMPKGYRSPGGSLSQKDLWLFDLLLDLGIEYDSSLYPRPHGLLEQFGNPSAPFVIRRLGNRSLWEFPSSVKQWLGFRWAFAEGGYFRLLPYYLVSRWFKMANSESRPVSMCLHPREVDPSHPRLPLSTLKSWRTYVALNGVEEKLKRLLDEHSFAPMGEVLRIYRGNL